MRRYHRILALALLTGCGPKIQEFEVTPRRICTGDTVSVTFKTRGEAHLTTVRRGGPLADTTTYTIVALAHGKQAYSRMDVITLATTQTLAFNTGMLGHDSLVARDSLPAEVWSGMKIDQIFADSGRGLVVVHGGKSGLLKPDGAGHPEWRGLLVSGAWELHSGLLAGEIPGNPAHHPPAHLYIRLSLSCQASGGQP